MDTKAEQIVKKAVKTADQIISFMVLTMVIILLAFAGYALWDSNQLYKNADPLDYQIYKPAAIDQGKSFQELQKINPEVFGWLSVYGTGIDYPLVQGQDNMKYVKTSAEGAYSLSGAIFLDCGNSRTFDDFNSIVYGHHMEKKFMFGEIGTFSQQKVFDMYQYGNLYFNGRDHGIHFFAFLHVDAYDGKIFNAGIPKEMRQAYLDNLYEHVIHRRNIGVTAKEQLILLSTCSSDSTNGRDILVGKVTDEVYSNAFAKQEEKSGNKQVGAEHLKNVKLQWRLPALLGILGALLVVLSIIYHSLTRKKRAVMVLLLLLGLTPMNAYGAENSFQLIVKQTFTSDDASVDNTFAYRLQPLETGSPMPAGSDAEGYDFSITGNASISIDSFGDDLPGVRRYELFPLTGEEKPGYIYDKHRYTLEIYVDRNRNSYLIVRNSNGDKAGDITFQQTYSVPPSDPPMITDPPASASVPGKGGSGVKTGEQSDMPFRIILLLAASVMIIYIKIKIKIKKGG